MVCISVTFLSEPRFTNEEVEGQRDVLAQDHVVAAWIPPPLILNDAGLSEVLRFRAKTKTDISVDA